MSSPFPTSSVDKLKALSLALALLGTGCQFRDRDDRVLEVKDRPQSAETVGFEKVLESAKELVRLYPSGPTGYTEAEIRNLYKLFAHSGSITESDFLKIIRDLDKNRDQILSPGDIQQAVGQTLTPLFDAPPVSGIYSRNDLRARLRGVFPKARERVMERMADALEQYDSVWLGGNGDAQLTRSEVLTASVYLHQAARLDLWGVTADALKDLRNYPQRSVEDAIILEELRTRVLQQYVTHLEETTAPIDVTYRDDLRAEQALLALRYDTLLRKMVQRPWDVVDRIRQDFGESNFDALMRRIYNRKEFGGDGKLENVTAFEALAIEMDMQWARAILGAMRNRYIPEGIVALPWVSLVGTLYVPRSGFQKVMNTVGSSMVGDAFGRSQVAHILEEHLGLRGSSSSAALGEYEVVMTLFFARLTNLSFKLFAGERSANGSLTLSDDEARSGLCQVMGDLADQRMVSYLYDGRTELTPNDFFALLLEYLYPRLR